MKNIFLIGDSIRFGAGEKVCGYGVCVKEKLAGKAEVYAPDENCRFAQYTLRYLHEWASKVPAKDIDIVHWNNGLWDLLHLCDDDAPFTPVEQYVQTLERIYRRIRFCFPNAKKIIFAANTPVIEAWGRQGFMRYNKEIEQYNAAAKALVETLGVQYNDLYAVASAFGEANRADWVHFDRTESELLADAVISAMNM